LKPAAILDIGSSKIVCLCGSTAVRGGTVVHGAGVADYAGYENAEFADEQSLEDAIVSAIRDAEEMARIRIRDMVVAVPAPFSRLIVTQATIRLESRRNRVTADDIDELISLSLAKARAPEHVLMHSTPICFTVDGYESPEVPEGKRAGEIAAEVSHMYVQESFLNLITRILEKLSIEISMCVGTPLAESLLLIPEEERVRPAVLIDVGYQHTDISLVENAALTAMTTIDMGGAQFASDLSFGLDIPLENAEQVKRKYTFLQEDSGNIETIRMLTGVKRVDRSVIELIVESRAEELADLIKKSLRQLGIRADTRPVTYLTGGGFMMRGSGEYLRQALGLRVKRDMPYMPDMNTPNYASAFGALDFVLRAGSGESESGSIGGGGGFFDKLRSLFIE